MRTLPLVTLLLALTTISCGRDGERPAPAEPVPPPPAATEDSAPVATPSADAERSVADPVRLVRRYRCEGGTEVTAERFADSDDLLVVLPGVAARMWMVESGRRSFRYRTRDMTAVVEGDALRLDLGDGRRLVCRADRDATLRESARLGGAELLAVTADGAWRVEVRPESILLVDRDGDRSFSVPRSGDGGSDGARRYTAVGDGRTVEVEVLDGPCALEGLPSGLDLAAAVVVDGSSSPACGTHIEPIVPRRPD